MGRTALSAGLGLAAPFAPPGRWHLYYPNSGLTVAVADERAAELVRQQGVAVTVTEADGSTAVHHVRNAVVATRPAARGDGIGPSTE